MAVTFQLACKSGREMRASELCELMPDSRTVQLAIKYASRLHLMQLAERLGGVAQLKADEEQQIENERYLMRCRVFSEVYFFQLSFGSFSSSVQ